MNILNIDALTEAYNNIDEEKIIEGLPFLFKSGHLGLFPKENLDILLEIVEDSDFFNIIELFWRLADENNDETRFIDLVNLDNADLSGVSDNGDSVLKFFELMQLYKKMDDACDSVSYVTFINDEYFEEYTMLNESSEELNREDHKTIIVNAPKSLGLENSAYLYIG